MIQNAEKHKKDKTVTLSFPKLVCFLSFQCLRRTILCNIAYYDINWQQKKKDFYYYQKQKKIKNNKQQRQVFQEENNNSLIVCKKLWTFWNWNINCYISNADLEWMN